EIAGTDVDNAELGIGTAGINDSIEPVCPDESRSRGAFIVMQPLFLPKLVDLMSDIEPRRRHLEFRNNDVDPLQRNIDGSGRLDIVLHALDRGPSPGET